MQLTAEILKEMIQEEIKIQSQKEVERKKESDRISRERKRSWDEPTYKLARGIFTEGDQEIEVSLDTEPEKLLKVIQYQAKEIERLRASLTFSADQIHNLCTKKGYRTFDSYLKTVNAVNAAEKGKLFDKKK